MDFYEILGVSRTASKSEIQSAYRRLCKKYHPDVMQGDSETARELAAEKFREIHEAASVLLDDEQRKMYDDASETGNEESSEMSDGESDTDVNHDSRYRFCEIVGWILGYIIWAFSKDADEEVGVVVVKNLVKWVVGVVVFVLGCLVVNLFLF